MPRYFEGVDDQASPGRVCSRDFRDPPAWLRQRRRGRNRRDQRGGADCIGGARGFGRRTPGHAARGSVVADGLPTDAWFEYGTDSSLATFDNTAREPVGYGMDNVPVDASITGLEAETTYYFRVCSSNARGTAKSTIANFTTSSVVPAPPVAATVAATSISSTTATLNGNVTPNSLATTAWFEYGTSSTLVHIHQHIVRVGRLRHHQRGGQRLDSGPYHGARNLLPGRRHEQFRDEPGGAS